MSCEHCQDHLIELAYRELTGEVHAAVAGHLAQCADCALEYCRLQADLQGIAAAHDDDAPSPKVASLLRERVAIAIAPSWWRRRLAPLRRPVPMYGVVLAAALPLAVWLATAMSGPARLSTNPPTSTPPAVTHYDATAVPPAHEGVL